MFKILTSCSKEEDPELIHEYISGFHIIKKYLSTTQPYLFEDMKRLKIPNELSDNKCSYSMICKVMCEYIRTLTSSFHVHDLSPGL